MMTSEQVQPAQSTTTRPITSEEIKAHAVATNAKAAINPYGMYGPPTPSAAGREVAFGGYERERAAFDAWWADKSDGYKRATGKGVNLSGVAWDAYYARALLAAERNDPRRGEDGEAITAQDPMAEYVAASLAWWLDDSDEADRLIGPAWERFWTAYYSLPVEVRRGS